MSSNQPTHVEYRPNLTSWPQVKWNYFNPNTRLFYLWVERGCINMSLACPKEPNLSVFISRGMPGGRWTCFLYFPSIARQNSFAEAAREVGWGLVSVLGQLPIEASKRRTNVYFCPKPEVPMEPAHLWREDIHSTRINFGVEVTREKWLARLPCYFSKVVQFLHLGPASLRDSCGLSMQEIPNHQVYMPCVVGSPPQIFLTPYFSRRWGNSMWYSSNKSTMFKAIDGFQGAYVSNVSWPKGRYCHCIFGTRSLKLTKVKGSWRLGIITISGMVLFFFYCVRSQDSLGMLPMTCRAWSGIGIAVSEVLKA